LQQKHPIFREQTQLYIYIYIYIYIKQKGKGSMPCNIYCFKSFWKLSSGLPIHVLPSCIFFTNLHIFLICTKSCSIP
jgi:hypothetical protein